MLTTKLSACDHDEIGETVVPQGRKITASVFKELLKSKIEQVEVRRNDLEGGYVAADVIDMETGEVMIEANHELTPARDWQADGCRHPIVRIFFPDRDDVGNVISSTLRKDAVKSQGDALLEIYRKLRPGDPPKLDTATQLFQGMFFDARKYDFSRVRPHEVSTSSCTTRPTPRRSTSAPWTRKTSSTRFIPAEAA